jgi:two-component system KDP operon response regulator KdpE
VARVLVVDDDLDILSAVQEALAEEGWDVVTAATAEEASLAGRCREIDVVLCDVLLNDGRHGRSVKEAFGTTLGLGQVPFAFMTASPREATSLRDEYVLRKPFGSSEVVELLNDALCDRARKRTRQAPVIQ